MTQSVFDVFSQIISQRKLSKALLRPGGTVGKAIITVSRSQSSTLRGNSLFPVSSRKSRWSALILRGASDGAVFLLLFAL